MLKQLITSSIGKKYIMAISGMMLCAFMVIHAIGNSTIFFGEEIFNSYAEHLHSLGFPVYIFEVVLLTLFSVHIYTGISLVLENRRARGNDRYVVGKTAGGSTIGSRSMIYTGLVIALFTIVHLLDFHFVPHDKPISDIVAPVLADPLHAAFYAFAMLALGFHLSHGCWSIFQSLGLNHPRYNLIIRITAWAITLLITAIFLFVVVLLAVNPNQLT